MIKPEKINMLTAVGFAISVLAVYLVLSYFHEKNRLLTKVDEKLFSAASAVPFVLADNFHERAIDAQSIGPDEDQHNIKNLSTLNNRLGTKFLYTVVRDQGGGYRLSSSSALKEELTKGEEVRYYTPYPDVSDTLKLSFEGSVANFSPRDGIYHALYVPVFSDRWGTYRSIFIPMRTLSGKTYVIGADIDISYVKVLLNENTLNTVLAFFIFTLAITPIVLAYIKVLKQKNTEYRKVHQLFLDQSQLSITDPLTQCYNRLKLDEELKSAFDLYQKQGRKFALLMTDIDNFKNINDHYGHQVGDTVLQNLAKILMKTSRLTDIVGRWGGEEFMIICRDGDINGAYHLAEKLRISIENYKPQHGCKITASFGVGEPHPNQTIHQFLQRVDEAMYKAKGIGRNNTVKAQSNEDVKF